MSHKDMDVSEFIDKALSGEKDFSGIVLPRLSTITDLDLSGCIFRGAALKDVVFGSVNLTGADLSNARLSHCVFSRCSLRDVYGPKSHFQDCTFYEGDISGMTLPYSLLSFTNFMDCTAPVGAALDGVTLNGVDFTNCDLKGASVTLDGEYHARPIARFIKTRVDHMSIHIINEHRSQSGGFDIEEILRDSIGVPDINRENREED